MAERLNAPDSKSGIPSRVSGVQIPLSPPGSRLEKSKELQDKQNNTVFTRVCVRACPVKYNDILKQRGVLPGVSPSLRWGYFCSLIG